MIVFLSAAAGILVYGAAYGVFCIKKGVVAAALSIFGLLLADLFLMALLIYFRTNT